MISPITICGVPWHFFLMLSIEIPPFVNIIPHKIKLY